MFQHQKQAHDNGPSDASPPSDEADDDATESFDLERLRALSRAVLKRRRAVRAVWPNQRGRHAEIAAETVAPTAVIAAEAALSCQE